MMIGQNQDPVIGQYKPLLGIDAWEHVSPGFLFTADHLADFLTGILVRRPPITHSSTNLYIACNIKIARLNTSLLFGTLSTGKQLRNASTKTMYFEPASPQLLSALSVLFLPLAIRKWLLYSCRDHLDHRKGGLVLHD